MCYSDSAGQLKKDKEPSLLEVIPKLVDNENQLNSVPSQGGNSWLGELLLTNNGRPSNSICRNVAVIAREGGRALDERKCFEGILWILWTGAPWSELPERYGSKSAVHRRLKEWAETDVLLNLWRAFLDLLSGRQKVRSR
jgi:transposase